MQYTPARTVELLSCLEWNQGEVIKVLWVRVGAGGRDEFARQVPSRLGSDLIAPLVLREYSFFNANAVLSDLQRLISANRASLEVMDRGCERITLLILAQEEFQLPLVSSPMVLPSWFPVKPGCECMFRISDLAATAEMTLLSCPESRVDLLAERVFRLEGELLNALKRRQAVAPVEVAKFLANLLGGGAGQLDVNRVLGDYGVHLDAVADPRGYRPNASEDTKSLTSKVLRLFLRSSPKDFSRASEVLSQTMGDVSTGRLKPSMLGLLLRPASKMTPSGVNWHTIMVSLFQAYQCMNGAAHAGEYPTYPVSLIYCHSLDLARALEDCRAYASRL